MRTLGEFIVEKQAEYQSGLEKIQEQYKAIEAL